MFDDWTIFLWQRNIPLYSLGPSGAYTRPQSNHHRRQAIIITYGGILLIRPLESKFTENLTEYLNIFIQENAFENIVW